MEQGMPAQTAIGEGPTVRSALGAQSKGIEVLYQTLGQLEKVLSPVLRPGTLVEVDTAPGDPSLTAPRTVSELTEAALDNSSAVEDINTRVQRLINGVNL